jgi:hypothetical protein
LGGFARFEFVTGFVTKRRDLDLCKGKSDLIRSHPQLYPLLVVTAFHRSNLNTLKIQNGQ